MPVNLRSANNPVTSAILLSAVRGVITPGTALCNVTADTTGLSQVYIRSRYAMSQGAFPAVNLTTGVQKFMRSSQRAYEGSVIVNVTYFNEWDQNNVQTQDEIVQAMEADLERIRANLESTESMPSTTGQYIAVSIPALSVSPDKGEFDQTFGKILIYRTLMASIVIQPYGV